MIDKDYWISKLGLTPHPEGGFYKEVFRSETVLKDGFLDNTYSGSRNTLTSIYFMLCQDKPISKFHKLKSDEIWYYHQGGDIDMYTIVPSGNLEVKTLGKEHSLQLIIPKNTWFAAKLRNQSEFSLMGCAVAPGFEFADFEMANQQTLSIQYPNHLKIIELFT